MSRFKHIVAIELLELETRDADQLFECIRENLQELGLEMTEALDEELYNEIERQLAALKIAK